MKITKISLNIKFEKNLLSISNALNIEKQYLNNLFCYHEKQILNTDTIYSIFTYKTKKFKFILSNKNLMVLNMDLKIHLKHKIINPSNILSFSKIKSYEYLGSIKIFGNSIDFFKYLTQNNFKEEICAIINLN